MITILPQFKDLIPPLSPEEYRFLEENILSEGCRDALVIWNGVLVDGHNRFEICSRNKLTYKTVDKHFKDEAEAEEWIIRNQFGRRNLTPFQRGELALKLKPIIEEKAKERQKATQLIGNGIQRKDMAVPKSAQPCEGKTRDELAKLAGVGHDTMQKVMRIKERGSPEQIQRARKGGAGNTVNAIYGEILNEGITSKICTKCGKEKPIEEFTPGKAQCRNCYNTFKIRGRDYDSTKCSPEVNALARKFSDAVVSDIYNTEKEITISSDDLFDDIESFSNAFIRNASRCVAEYSVEVTPENKQKIIAVLTQTEAAIQKMKGCFIHE